MLFVVWKVDLGFFVYMKFVIINLFAEDFSCIVL